METKERGALRGLGPRAERRENDDRRHLQAQGSTGRDDRQSRSLQERLQEDERGDYRTAGPQAPSTESRKNGNRRES